MIDRAAAGGPADHRDIVGLHKGPVDLLLRVLVLSYHYGVLVLPKHQILSLGPMGQNELLKSQIIARVFGTRLQIVYRFFHMRLLVRLRAGVDGQHYSAADDV